LEGLLQKLFCLHDLNNNGWLEELELIWINEKIALLHYGNNIDRVALAAKYTGLFRGKLDPHGLPVPYMKFRQYTVQCLDMLDSHEQAQEMIMEQFVAEAETVRHIFPLPAEFHPGDMGEASTPEEEEEVVMTDNAVCMLGLHDLASYDDIDIDPHEESFHEKPRTFLANRHVPAASGRLLAGGRPVASGMQGRWVV
jgi:hypothetical protein